MTFINTLTAASRRRYKRVVEPEPTDPTEPTTGNYFVAGYIEEGYIQ